VRPRITEVADRAKVVRSDGTAHPLAAAAVEIGRVPSATPMERVVLKLKASAEPQAALDQLVADQHDPASPRYHQWVTPAEFAARFGPAPEDISAISDWLTGMGLTVD
jgi:subtilase family serine protease